MEQLGSVQLSQPALSVTPQVAPELRPEDRELIKAVRALNATELFGEEHELAFLIDRQSRRPVVRIVDKETKEVVRQIPPEYVLRMAEDFQLRG